MAEKANFNIDDFDNEISSDCPPVKQVVQKHSKMYLETKAFLERNKGLIDEISNVYGDNAYWDFRHKVHDLIQNVDDALLCEYLARPWELDEETRNLRSLKVNINFNDIFSELGAYCPVYRMVQYIKSGGVPQISKKEGNRFHELIEKLSKVKSMHDIYHSIYKPESKEEIQKIIRHCKNDVGLNWLDVRELTDFSSLFEESTFDGDISMWRLNNAENCDRMFYRSYFNGDISRWKFPKTKSMNQMFAESRFDGDISEWEFPEVITMRSFFEDANFRGRNGGMADWKFPKVKDMSHFFSKSRLDTNISRWQFPCVENMSYMFEDAYSFDSDISKWQFPEVTDMTGMFKDSSYTGDLSNWKFPKVKSMNAMFLQCNTIVYMGSLTKWEFPEVEDMTRMFLGSDVPADISEWKFPKVRLMTEMFRSATIYSDIEGWEFPMLENCVNMLKEACCSSDVSKWRFPANCDTTDYNSWIYEAAIC